MYIFEECKYYKNKKFVCKMIKNNPRKARIKLNDKLNYYSCNFNKNEKY